ncbi:MAG: PTS mannose transporter subunit IIA, partial [Erysipelotrichaceae bacterium]|nr:PTS mannose transporter subunit IIA [Erysipelotrichaceae bacterium]
MSNVRIVLASHGKLAAGMLNTVQMLLGQLDNITAYCLMPEEDVNAFAKKLEEEVKTYGAENILFMTELIHGSPFNSVVGLTREYDIHHISGTNLAMLMEVVLARNEDGITLD